MIKELSIKNYALIEDLHVSFGPGLNILTGETGAGKSIIIGALGLLLGDRAQKEVIRQGASTATVEGIFQSIPKHILDRIQSEFEIPSTDGELILRREVHENGRSRNFVNDSPVSLNSLSELGDLLVDLHGQHDHQALLKINLHLDYLDRFGVDSALLDTMESLYRKFIHLTGELDHLIKNETQLKQKRELLQFQVDEIQRLGPTIEEEAELVLEEKLMKNSERIFQVCQTLTSTLHEDENAVINIIAEMESQLTPLLDVDTPFKDWQSECEQARIALQDVVNEFQSYAAKLEFDPERLEQVRECLGQYALLKKKYGGDTDQVVQFQKSAQKQLDEIGSMDSRIQELQEELESNKKEIAEVALLLDAQRKESSKKLQSVIMEELNKLGLLNGQFLVQLERETDPNGPITIEGENCRISARGANKAEFLISLNPGQDPRPLAKIASGGEISRIMLALKTVLAEADAIPVLIFDEIDTGISGRIARIVGQSLSNLAQSHQLICITHLPQIASMGRLHYTVEKQSENEVTQTLIRALSAEDRVFEIGKLLGGEEVTDSVLQNARELLNS
ncbi:DNA repair protein RecN [candidate division KSB1 bacterium]|nr:DNA repair protein RecN [candidate division KSB1 bacterium]